MTKITLKGNPIHTIGNLPSVGSMGADFTAVDVDLKDVSLKHFLGNKIILNIFPSLDTDVCAKSVRKFNKAANELDNVTVLCISMDLPFAQKRFCVAEGLSKVKPLSVFRNPEFGKAYGVTIVEGPLKELMSRAIVILDEKGKVIYTQQVPEITEEPDYEKALKVLE